MDVLVYGWVCEKYVCVDLIGVSLVVELGVGDFTKMGSPQSYFKQNAQT
jgi:hypothetical protein